ncbi:MAG: ABC transporter ATP-binding protein [Desulfurococcales archaeon]|nr:ABC transporter ATP-binding protein [Desulfurococcales archaeon]
MVTAVEVVSLRKVFGNVVAVDGISFKVEEGEIFGLVGPNGAGKTTTLRILATLLRPTSGSVRVFGRDVVKECDEVRKLIAYLPEEAGAYKYLTGYEYLRFMAKVYGYGDEVVEEGIRLAGLGDAIHRYVGTYSKGMKRRLQVARTLMVRPKLAIMDEPTSGLDVIHAVYVRDIIKNYVKKYGITVIVSSHNMLEVEYLCDRIALLGRGRIVAIGNPKELISKYDAKNLEEVFVKVVGRATE